MVDGRNLNHFFLQTLHCSMNAKFADQVLWHYQNNNSPTKYFHRCNWSLVTSWKIGLFVDSWFPLICWVVLSIFQLAVYPVISAVSALICNIQLSLRSHKPRLGPYQSKIFIINDCTKMWFALILLESLHGELSILTTRAHSWMTAHLFCSRSSSIW